MRIIHQSPQQLVVSSQPWMLAIFSSIMIAMSLLFMLAMIDDLYRWPVALLVLFIFFLGGCLLFYADVIYCQIDQSSACVTVRRKGLWRDRTFTVTFAELRAVQLYGRRYKGRVYYKVRLLLHNGKAIPLMESRWWNAKKWTAIAQTLSHFLALPLKEDLGYSPAGLQMLLDSLNEIR
ncbi:MAG: hypothetical protein AAFY33_11065 [Cyanobacteria bacterium J06643_4]